MDKDKPTKKLRQDAQDILRASLDAVDPEGAVRRFVELRGETVRIKPTFELDLKAFGRIFIVGGGKASAPMAKALEDLLGDRVEGGVICVKYGHGMPLAKTQVLEGGHPLPDRGGEEAARRIIDLLRPLREDDLVFSVISGGGSALLPAPAEGITLTEKQELTRRLLAVGATIHEMNAVRKHMSLTKGGNLMRWAYPAPVVNLMLSDVVGDDPDTIASGPFVPDRSTFTDVLGILDRYGLVGECPASILKHMRDGASGLMAETPKRGDGIFTRAFNVIVGSNIIALLAGAQRARDLGYNTMILSSTVEGDTSEVAAVHGAVAREIRSTGNPLQVPACVLSGGETTVVIKGEGMGGRNQEFALSLVETVSGIPGCLIMSVGTDGTDGPTDAAGAMVDEETFRRAESLGLDYRAFLNGNDSYNFFKALGDLVVTGPTRTNVMDVRMVLLR